MELTEQERLLIEHIRKCNIEATIAGIEVGKGYVWQVGKGVDGQSEVYYALKELYVLLLPVRKDYCFEWKNDLADEEESRSNAYIAKCYEEHLERKREYARINGES